MSVNAPLLRKVLEHITAHTDEWNQAKWAIRTRCGTACCVAGHVALMTGHELRFEDDGTADFTTDGRLISNVASKELNLDENHRYLFAAHYRLSDLWQIANEITHGEIKVPEEFK